MVTGAVTKVTQKQDTNPRKRSNQKEVYFTKRKKNNKTSLLTKLNKVCGDTCLCWARYIQYSMQK